MADTPTVDVRVSGGGTVYLFAPLTERAREWVKEHVPTEKWQWFGNAAFAVEHRFAEDLAEAMTADGLEVR